MTLLKADSGLLRAAGEMLRTPGFFDTFATPGPVRVGGAKTGFDDFPLVFPQIEARDGHLYIPNGFTPVTGLQYDSFEDFLENPPPHHTDFHGGITYVRWPTPWVNARSTVRWCGDGASYPEHFYEVGPSLHFTLDHWRLNMGLWSSGIGDGYGLFFFGSIGNPPTLFWVDSVGFYAQDDQEHDVALESYNGEIRGYYDGEEIQQIGIELLDPETLDFQFTGPLDYLPVPEPLAASTDHGVSVDTHLQPNPDQLLCDWVSIVEVTEPLSIAA